MLPAERRTVMIGLAVSALALVMAYGVVPNARRWNEREALIAARTGQLARMRQAVADSAVTHAALVRAELGARAWPLRAVAAPNREVASSVLQAQLRGWVERAGAQLTRLDVKADEAGASDVQATVTVVADAAGLAALLDDFRDGPPAVSVRTLEVRVNPVLRGPSALMNVTIGARAPWRRE